MDDLAQQHGVGLVMIYRDWFPTFRRGGNRSAL
jgi:hypothetical protein